MISSLLLKGSSWSVIFFFLLLYGFTQSPPSFNNLYKELGGKNKCTTNNTMFYTPIMENALTLLIGIGIVVALIFLIVMVIDWISDGVMDIFEMFE